MKKVLISIKPKWVFKICNKIGERDGKPLYEKTVEVRKTKPKIDVPFKCYIYCTKNGNSLIKDDISTTIDFIAKNGGKVIGEFVCNAIISHCEMANADIAEIQGCIKREKLLEYSNGKELFGWHISDLEIYDKPMELSEFIVPSKIGCCNEGKCRGCKYLDRGNGFNIEDDCNAKFNTDEYKPLRKAPQSWCYIEEV